jgi:hypothetical protein
LAILVIPAFNIHLHSRNQAHLTIGHHLLSRGEPLGHYRLSFGRSADYDRTGFGGHVGFNNEDKLSLLSGLDGLRRHNDRVRLVSQC